MDAFANSEAAPHIVLVGGGIMSATLGVLLKRLWPEATIDVFERLDRVAAESSDAWNNAGTGHSAFCELNYTPEDEQGNVDCRKAVAISESFELSRQLWASWVEDGILPDPEAFIRTVPHCAFVWGESDRAYLRKRYEGLMRSPLFEGMVYSEDPAVITGWMPLVMAGRDPAQPLAATRMDLGTDVDFGALTRGLFEWLGAQEGVHVHLVHEVLGMSREGRAPWMVEVHDRAWGTTRKVAANFVFIGAGGGALPLLEASGIPEGQGYGGFPVSGIWLRCTNPEVIAQHHAKVYGRASVGAPPMSVPHLDTRVIEGEKALLFGPFAGFSSKFLKRGSYLDLFRSVTVDNVIPMMSAGIQNIPLTLYLIDQLNDTADERIEALRAFVPEARAEDWELRVAGQRVQTIRPEGVLGFGTEIVRSADGTVAALLGASPGASTSVAILVELVEACFAQEVASAAWQEKLREMLPSYGQKLADHPEERERLRRWTSKVLHLSLVDEQIATEVA